MSSLFCLRKNGFERLFGENSFSFPNRTDFGNDPYLTETDHYFKFLTTADVF